MSSFADVFRVLNQMRDEGAVREYALGGATAVLFYAEPTRTYDVDVFVLLPVNADEALVSLTAIYAWARDRGFPPESEHLMIHGVPVQVIPAYNRLVADAIDHARIHDYDGVQVRVVSPEYLIALALQAGGARRRERAWQLLETAGIDRKRLQALLTEHNIGAEIPDDV